MFTKTLVVASTLAAGTAAKPAVVQQRAASTTIETSNMKRTTAQSASVDSSAVVTSGGFAEIGVSDCNNPEPQPLIDGTVIGVCKQTGSSTSNKSTGCEWIGSDQTELNVYTSTYTSGDCTGTASPSTETYSGLTNGCFDDKKWECGTDVTASKYSPKHIGYFDNNGCSGNEYAWSVTEYPTTCLLSNPPCSMFDESAYEYIMEICDSGDSDESDDYCFHVDTKIDYKGVEYTYEELKAGKEPECTVPHAPASKGVVISTSCDKTVRVTDTHLMATTKGFQLAYSLNAGDVLYGDYGKDMCTVKSVEKEKTAQQYFGLNCVHSEVLASGLRASTFGDFHTLPSWYMTYVGGLVGTETASSLGEYIAEWYFQK